MNKKKLIAEHKASIANIQRRMCKLQIELKDMKLRTEKAESQLEPMKESLDSLTAERGKWLRKLRRAGVKV